MRALYDLIGFERPTLMPTPRSTIAREGTARLYRFHDEDGGECGGQPVLLVPSIINRWYVLDLRPGASVVEALVADGHDVYCLDWGTPEDEDRYLEWDDLIARIGRMVSIVLRTTKARRVGLVGYCMGATLAAIYAALHPNKIGALVDLLGPIDFAHAGKLGHAVDPRWFDVDAMVEAGNISAAQMQMGFLAMRPTLHAAKWVGFADRIQDPASRASFYALETWSGDNIPFPAAAYRTYIRELYQDNALVAGTHRVAGRGVKLDRITCPVMSVVAERDEICPPPAADALLDRVSSTDTERFVVPGGHVGAVIGSKAKRLLYPKLSGWLQDKLRSGAAAET